MLRYVINPAVFSQIVLHSETVDALQVSSGYAQRMASTDTDHHNMYNLRQISVLWIGFESATPVLQFRRDRQ
jgi:hypothetical protein